MTCAWKRKDSKRGTSISTPGWERLRYPSALRPDAGIADCSTSGRNRQACEPPRPAGVQQASWRASTLQWQLGCLLWPSTVPAWGQVFLVVHCGAERRGKQQQRGVQSRCVCTGSAGGTRGAAGFAAPAAHAVFTTAGRHLSESTGPRLPEHTHTHTHTPDTRTP